MIKILHPFNFNLVACLHFEQPNLPPKLREIIFEGCLEARKEWCKNKQNLPYTDLSKSSRRAKRYFHCQQCGNWEHEGKCKQCHTYAQCKYVHLIELGPIRLLVKRTLRKESIVAYQVRGEFR